MSDFDVRLRIMMDRRGYSITRLAREMGIERQLTWNWVHGKSHPDLYHFAMLVRVLDASPYYLLFGQEV